MIFFLSCLAVWRISHMLVKEDGPWDIIVKIRNWVDGTTWAKLMDCHKCSSVWVAFLFSGCLFDKHFVAYWLALSAVSMFIEVTYELLRTKAEIF